MVLRVLLLCSAFILAGCGSASAPAQATAAYPEEAAPEPGDDGYGYSFEDGNDRSQTDLDFALVPTVGQSAAGGMPAPPRTAAPIDLPRPPDDPQPGLGQDTPTDPSRKPMLIYRARLGLAVFKVQEQLDTIEKMSKDQGGYLVARTQNEIRVRVPADHFQEAVDAILKLGDINFRHVTTDDVTAEFTDLEIRLKNALSVRERMQALLEKAQKVEEAIEVERELQRLTDEIETMKGRMKLLHELAAYSTIEVSFEERSSQLKSRVELPFPWLKTLGLEHLLSL